MDTLSPPQIPQMNRTPAGVRAAEHMLQAGNSTQPRIGETFSDLLNRASSGDGLTPQQHQQKEAEKVAGDLVSQALILPMLKQLRRGSLATNPVFGGGLGEKTFGPEFDIQIADRLAHSPQLGVTKNLAERIIRRGNAQMPQKTRTLGTKADLNG